MFGTLLPDLIRHTMSGEETSYFIHPAISGKIATRYVACILLSVAFKIPEERIFHQGRLHLDCKRVMQQYQLSLIKDKIWPDVLCTKKGKIWIVRVDRFEHC